ncbi:MAG: hypothetical protein EOM67_05010 [Spirochaetia bacterium]|nr:hypothetical protein [Spirochaetia bacterium]
MMSMKLHKKGEKLLEYRISRINKISYALFAFIMIIGLFSFPLDELISFRSLLPFTFLFISLLGLGYRESWEFDPIKKEVRSVHGVFFLVKREIIPFNTIRHLEISHFTKGYQESKKTGDRGRNKSMTVFSIRLITDSVKQIEIIPERVNSGRTDQIALEIASEMNLPFVVDREYDSINKVELSDI